jgi:hypothetical protein
MRRRRPPARAGVSLFRCRPIPLLASLAHVVELSPIVPARLKLPETLAEARAQVAERFGVPLASVGAAVGGVSLAIVTDGRVRLVRASRLGMKWAERYQELSAEGSVRLVDEMQREAHPANAAAMHARLADCSNVGGMVAPGGAVVGMSFGDPEDSHPPTGSVPIRSFYSGLDRSVRDEAIERDRRAALRGDRLAARRLTRLMPRRAARVRIAPAQRVRRRAGARAATARRCVAGGAHAPPASASPSSSSRGLVPRSCLRDYRGAARVRPSTEGST